MPSPPDRPTDLGESTDLCVKCGLCLPHCPTYGLSRQEGDSPRGRIALIQGLAAGRLAPEPRLTDHLGGCLTCRSCESVCPAKVPYGDIIDQGKALLRARGDGADKGVGVMRWLARRPGLLRCAPAVLGLGRRLGIPAVARRLAPGHWLSRALALRPGTRAAPRAGTVHEPAGSVRGDVSLFLGCVARGLDGTTLSAAVAAATTLGFRVRIPAGQGCCGALDLHDGRPAAAATAARRNAQAFGTVAEPILCAATGCAITLAETRGDDEAAGTVAARTVELTRFLASRLEDRPLVGPRRPERVAVHVSCTARLLPGAGDDLVSILSRIPNVEPVTLGAARCCGAAGHHFLTRAGQADALRAPLLDELIRLAPDRVVSANAGCALHLAAGLAERRGEGPPIPVTHPVTLVVRALSGDW
jgi:glycolate oxidase iron-sulfur subunit